MADASTNTTLSHGAGRFFADIFGGLWDAVIRVGEANSKIRKIEALSSLSDEELAQRGLARQDIIRHVMGCSV
ncbi:DUF1127 domain-containing protein [Lutimaribacter marinistellae]|uniref:DUF1127 domain-containing protein n=1 Tax=Lutimaribacter marinistellae TaxID=1820329 RepID=A0ABV7TJX0_9RHOB